MTCEEATGRAESWPGKINAAVAGRGDPQVETFGTESLRREQTAQE